MHDFVKILKFRCMWKYTLHLALGCAVCGATKFRYKCANFIDFSTIVSCEMKDLLCNYVFWVRYFVQVARNSISFVCCN